MGLFGKSKKELERDAIFAILVLANFYSYGQEIPGTAPAFLAGGKNLLDVHG